MDELSLRKNSGFDQTLFTRSIRFWWQPESSSQFKSVTKNDSLPLQKRPSPEVFYTPGNGRDPYIGLMVAPKLRNDAPDLQITTAVVLKLRWIRRLPLDLKYLQQLLSKAWRKNHKNVYHIQGKCFL